MSAVITFFLVIGGVVVAALGLGFLTLCLALPGGLGIPALVISGYLGGGGVGFVLSVGVAAVHAVVMTALINNHG